MDASEQTVSLSLNFRYSIAWRSQKHKPPRPENNVFSCPDGPYMPIGTGKKPENTVPMAREYPSHISVLLLVYGIDVRILNRLILKFSGRNFSNYGMINHGLCCDLHSYPVRKISFIEHNKRSLRSTERRKTGSFRCLSWFLYKASFFCFFNQYRLN